MRNRVLATRPPLRTTGHLFDPRSGASSAADLAALRQVKPARALLLRRTLQVKCGAHQEFEALRGIGPLPGFLRLPVAAPGLLRLRAKRNPRRAVRVDFQSASEGLPSAKTFACCS